MVKSSLSVPCFIPFRCIQCKHFFVKNELLLDWRDHPFRKTITCPECGVENVR